MEEILKLQRSLENIIISNFLKQILSVIGRVGRAAKGRIKIRTEFNPKFHAKLCINTIPSLSIT